MAASKIQIAPELVAEGKRRAQPGEGGADFGEEVRAKHAWH
jgi:hypothetical protein